MGEELRMTSPANQSNDIIRAAGQSLANQRAGGRRVRSIGRGSAGLKAKHFGKKLRNVLLAIGGLWLALTVAGIVLDGIGITGIILGVLATVIAVGVFGSYPKMKLPSRVDLTADNQNVRQLVGQTELWLESQRRALPPPAVKLVDHIGLQLDALGLQLQDLDQSHPKATEVRKLVGEHLPNVIDGYRKIPDHLRHEEHSGTTPAKQFMDSLSTISGEIDSVTRQLAAGAIDNLSIQNRYLEYKYGAGPEAE
jgi:hypothetical protein